MNVPCLNESVKEKNSVYSHHFEFFGGVVFETLYRRDIQRRSVRNSSVNVYLKEVHGLIYQDGNVNFLLETNQSQPLNGMKIWNEKLKLFNWSS